MNVRRSIAVAAAVLTLPSLASCGFDVYTNRQYTPGVGTYSKASSVDVLNAVIVSSERGEGTLVTTLVNNDLENEGRLVSITGTGTDPVEVSISGETTIAPESFIKLSDAAQVTVTGDAVRQGFFVELTYAFDNADSVTLMVPIEDWDPDGPYGEVPLP